MHGADVYVEEEQAEACDQSYEAAMLQSLRHDVKLALNLNTSHGMVDLTCFLWHDAWYIPSSSKKAGSSSPGGARYS